MIKPFESIIPNKFRLNNPGDKLHKGVRVLKSVSLDPLYSALTSVGKIHLQLLLMGLNQNMKLSWARFSKVSMILKA